MMGIKGLPEVLRPWLTPVQVSQYKGKRAAVDAYSWLHKGAYSCALELGTGDRWWVRQRRDAPYVRYCVHRAQMLRHFGVTPVIVFDGDRLPAKGDEELERRERRAEAKRKGHERLTVGDREGASFHFAQGLDVTPAMAHELIAALKREGFEFVVAPYEADAQIAALAAIGGGPGGGVDIVFTEDSDLVAYGCPTVLFKLDKFGDAQELRLADVLAGPPGAERGRAGGGDDAAATGGPAGGGGRTQGSAAQEGEKRDSDDADAGAAARGNALEGCDEEDDVEDMIAVSNGPKGKGGKGKGRGSGGKGKSVAKTKTKGGTGDADGGNAASSRLASVTGRSGALKFVGWDHELFLGLCVLSGCDFLPNVRGIGIKKAHGLVTKHRTIKATLAVMHGDKKINMPEGYDANFQRAFWTFRHARVYDPQLRQLRPLNPMPPELADEHEDTSFLGAMMDAATAVEIAEGRLDPITRQPFVIPPSPQKQRGWVPSVGRHQRSGGRSGGSFQQQGRGRGGGNGRWGHEPPDPIAAEKKAKSAFVSLFTEVAKASADKAKTKGEYGGGRFDDNVIVLDEDAGLGGDDGFDDDAVAAMMEQVERGERSNAGAAAATLFHSELKETSTPVPNTRHTEVVGAESADRPPSCVLPARLGVPETARSAAAVGHSAQFSPLERGDGGEENGWEAEGSRASQRPGWPSTAVTNAPVNRFARAAPVKRAGSNVLAGLFAAAAKKGAQSQLQQAKRPQQPQQSGVSNPFAKLGVSTGGGSSSVTAVAPKAKKGTMQSFFSKVAAPGVSERSSDVKATEKVWSIAELRNSATTNTPGVNKKRRKT